jgi:hypothetical protein
MELFLIIICAAFFAVALIDFAADAWLLPEAELGDPTRDLRKQLEELLEADPSPLPTITVSRKW